MPYYRAHILDQLGALTGAVDLDCVDDEAAKERVRVVLDGHPGEVWRLVARFEPDNPSKGFWQSIRFFYRSRRSLQ
jgi:hypothetical protein